MQLTVFILLNILVLVSCQKKKKTPSPIVECKQSNKYENPKFIKDRIKKNYVPELPETWGQTKKRPYTDAWMDYCDPRHCGAYHKMACGMNRRNIRFQWFQSVCHIKMNNACARYRGFLKFDHVDDKYCRLYVKFALRNGCPSNCPTEENPVCAVNVVDNRVTIFKNICYLYRRNCRGVLPDFVEVDMNVCINDLQLALKAIEQMHEEELVKKMRDEGANKEPDGPTAEQLEERNAMKEIGNRYLIGDSKLEDNLMEDSKMSNRYLIGNNKLEDNLMEDSEMSNRYLIGNNKKKNSYFVGDNRMEDNLNDESKIANRYLVGDNKQIDKYSLEENKLGDNLIKDNKMSNRYLIEYNKRKDRYLDEDKLEDNLMEENKLSNRYLIEYNKRKDQYLVGNNKMEENVIEDNIMQDNLVGNNIKKDRYFILNKKRENNLNTDNKMANRYLIRDNYVD